MANCLLDFIELTEYIPTELREQLTLIRTLDLVVKKEMDNVEKEIKQFASDVDSLTEEERQKQHENFLKRCDVAFSAAGSKVKLADKLHDLVEKSMRLLDQGLDKLKKELVEGDKAYIVEEIERRSREIDEQIRAEEDNLLMQAQQWPHRQPKISASSSSTHEPKSHSKSRRLSNESATHSKSNHSNNKNDNHRLSHSALQLGVTSSANQRVSNSANSSHHYHRIRNNSTDSPGGPVDRSKKRERKRLNSAMTIFNRNSRMEDEILMNSNLSTSSPLTPEYLAGMQNNMKSFNNGVANDVDVNLSLKGMIGANNRSLTGINDKSNGGNSLAGAKQPILTATDAAHAVSPNATNSDKLVLFSSNSNGDKHNTNINDEIRHKSTNSFVNTYNQHQNQQSIGNQSSSVHGAQQNQLGNHLLSTIVFNSGDSTHGSRNPIAIPKSNHFSHNEQTNATNIVHTNATSNPSNNNRSGVCSFSSLPLSSTHDPLMIAASQAINATQNMTLGRRTSSLKASYAAVNSGRLQTASGSNHHHQQQQQQQMFDQQSGQQLIHEVYCKCRSHIQGSDMIACDNSDCKIEWFHYDCVGITAAPPGEWYCEDCRLSLNIQKKPTKQAKLEGVNVS